MISSDNIGARLKHWMEENGYSAISFAEKAEIQRSALSHIFSGRNKPSVDVLFKIKKAFPHIDLQWLITGEKSDIHTTGKEKDKGSDPELESDDVTHVTFKNKSIDSQLIDDDLKLKPKANRKTPKLIRILELYSDGSFRYFDAE